MKWEVKEFISSITEPTINEYKVKINAVEDYGKIPMSIILSSGDMIVGEGNGYPRRFPSGTTGQILTADETLSQKMRWADPSASGWGGMAVYNNTGATIYAGSIVKISGTVTIDTNEYPAITLATASDSCWLYVVLSDIANGKEGTITGACGNVIAVNTSGTVNAGDGVAVSSTDGIGEASGAYDTIGIALTPNNGTKTSVVITNRRTNRTVFKTALDSPTIDNVEYRLGEINSLSIVLPDSPNAEYICAFVFKSSSSWSGMTFNKTVKLTGDSLTLKSRYYNVIVWWDGSVWWAKGTQAS